jgi:hypothetical protein
LLILAINHLIIKTGTKANNLRSNQQRANHREETKASIPRKQQETITTLKSQLATNKMSEHYTLIDNAMKEINGDMVTHACLIY